jgi:hypothetical protein
MVRIGNPKVDSCRTAHLMGLIDEGTSAASVAVSLKRSITVIRTGRGISTSRFLHGRPALMIFYC